MRVDRYVGRAVTEWTLLAVALAGGLAWMATAVESARHGALVALWAAVLTVPGVLVPLAPLLCALGAALAAARLDSRGERVGLAAVGLGPMRTARAALAVGLFVGASQWLVAGFVVHRAEESRRALVGTAEPEWVWLDDGAVRVSDGVRVEVQDGRISSVWRPDDLASPPAALDASALAEARMRQEPRIASAAVLRRSGLVTAAVERLGRLARIAACGGLAVLGWLPLSPRPSQQVGRALALSLAWVALDLVLQAMGAQSQVPLWLGSAGAAAALWVGLTVAWVRGQ